MVESREEEVLYEIRHHANMPFFSDSFKQKVSRGSREDWRSYLSLSGAKQFKEKWAQYRQPKTLKKSRSLFVSPNGEYVAVAAGNQIFIFQKGDEYMNPIGIYTSNDRLSVFTNGAWLEPHGILGVIDNMNTLFLVKSSGEELARRTKSQLRLSAPIFDLIVQSDVNTEKSFWCGFCVFTEDGLLHHVDVSQEPSACICTLPTLRNRLIDKKQFPQNVYCLDFHSDLSFGVLVGSSSVSANSRDKSGSYCVYLFRVTTTSELELMFCSPQFQGLFFASKGYIGPFTSPKVSISPHARYAAVLDLNGRVDVFNLNTESYYLSHVSFAERILSHTSDSVTQHDTIDISWWNDDTLILAKREGNISMYSIVRGVKVIENDPIFCRPVIERMKSRQEHIFVLESRSSDESRLDSGHTKDRNVQHIRLTTSLNENQFLNDKLCWKLLSLSGKSVSEMYAVLIRNQQYQSALDFASRHNLDKNAVFKEQWLHSDQGIHEMNMLLSKITDQMFVLHECLDKVGPTEDVVKYLLFYGLRITEEYKFLDNDAESITNWDFRMIRLNLLQYRDKLETFVGINMGRFSAEEYRKFRAIPLGESAISLAESGKIGALDLLFKRHPYSLSPRILDILCAIPETISVQSYGQLLPGRSPPSTVGLREDDWIECEKMISFINNLPSNSEECIQLRTENILKRSLGFVWPSIAELLEWYKSRTRDIDYLSGQLDNCIALLEFACCKGIVELQQFLEDTSYLHQLIYANDCEEGFTMSLVTWEQLSDYEKFRMMLKGVNDETVVRRLQEAAVPFMKKRFCPIPVGSEEKMKEGRGFPCQGDRDSFVVRWLKEIAVDNLLELCLAVIENGCGDSPVDGLFKDEAEMIDTALHCIYLCTITDQWNIMASILSILPRKTVRENTSKEFSPRHGTPSLGIPRFSYLRSQLGKPEMQLSSASPHDEEPAPQNSQGFVKNFDDNACGDKLEIRIKVAEGHVEVGRLLAFYQVPKPMCFFLHAQSDEKNVKQLLRLILSKFGRRQPGRSDNDWANMWRDMQCFQEKAFPFLDTEYMLIEFCRGLLKAGKFSLARNYLKGTGSITLATDKAESLVIQAAREYFFAASSLFGTEIWKAKECLSLFPNSKVVQAEANIIDALTIRLPNLGVTLLPMQYKQIKNPMEIINMVISSQPGAYLNVDEIIEIAKLLGLSSPDDVAAVEEAIAREAAVAGDLQLAFDLCLVLAKKGHGPIWDLCAAIARGPHLDNMDASSRKQLLSFALSHCDEESIGELLHAWKDVDILMQCESLMVSTQTCPPDYSIQGSSVIPHPVQSVRDIFDLKEKSKAVHQSTNFLENVGDVEVDFNNIKDVLFRVGKELSSNEDGISWDSLLKENKKVLSFAALELPWLLELWGKQEYGKPAGNDPKRHYVAVRTQALISILYWLANNNIAPSDDLIASIAKSIMERPVNKEEDILGCLFLLNLADAFRGVEVIEEQLKQREGYQEMFSIMNVGMAYSSLQNAHREYSSPSERRKLLLHKFQERHSSFTSDELEQIDKAQSTFWREWKTKLEEQKRVADQARMLEQIIPGIETSRFLSGDTEYIKTLIFSFIDTIKTQKKHILKEAVMLADIYGLNQNEVLLRFFGSALVSNYWGNDDILNEISEFREGIVKCAKDVITMITSVVYPEIDGRNKQRLSYIYGILSACYLRLKKTDEQALVALTLQYQPHRKHNFEPHQFYKILEHECQRVSFINELDFKNIAGLDDLNFGHINEEISNNIHESTVEALSDMVQALASIYSDSEALVGLISWQAIYKHHIENCLAYLESEIQLKHKNDVNPEDSLEIIGIIELNYDVCNKYIRSLAEADQSGIIGRYCTLCVPPCSSSWKLSDEYTQKNYLVVLINFWIKMVDDKGLDTRRLARCIKMLSKLATEDEISKDCLWSTITRYSKLCLNVGLDTDISSLLQAMIFSGCEFKLVAQVYSEAELYSSLSLDGKINNLLDLYANLMEKAFLNLSKAGEEHQDLHHLLTSLSKLGDGDHAEDLNMIRCQVWGKLTAFSNDMHLESHLRVYALELMQAITGQNLTSLSTEIVSMVQPWEGWEHSCFPSGSPITAESAEGSSNSITSTLIALRSTRLLATMSPDIKIAPEELITLDSAISCFLCLSELASSLPDLNVLRAVLEEWEVLFPSNKEKPVVVESVVEEFNNWSSDEWDNEGWENLPEEELGKMAGSKNEGISIRSLHSCWMEIIRKLIGLAKLDLVMEMLDKSFSKSNGVEVLIDEDEAQCLYNLVFPIDCFSALKILLLLPYRGPQLQCLHAIEATLPNNATHSVDSGYELLILVLASDVLKDIASNPIFCKVLTYLCSLVGYLARLCQEGLLKDKDGFDRKRVLPFCTVLLPCFISQLVESGQCILAGFIVTQWMHTHSFVGLIDVVEVSLKKYLEVQFLAAGGESACESCGSLVYSLSRLRGKVSSMLQYAISALPSDTPH